MRNALSPSNGPLQATLGMQSPHTPDRPVGLVLLALSGLFGALATRASWLRDWSGPLWVTDWTVRAGPGGFQPEMSHFGPSIGRVWYQADGLFQDILGMQSPLYHDEG